MASAKTFQRTCIALAISQSMVVSISEAASVSVGTESDSLVAVGCSLRAAIVSVNTNTAQAPFVSSGSGVIDTINFTGSVNNIALDSALPVITQAVSINGSGEDNLTLNGSDLHRVFTLSSQGI